MSKQENIFSNILIKIFPEKPRRKVIAVLGMHRSGTSCLTGLLEDAGVFLGNVSKNNPHNHKGNQENLRIMLLHDAVLSDNGAAWDNPPSSNAVWNTERKKELEDIIKEYEGEKLWAFKDPRALFTLEGWLKMLPGLNFIGTFRHPVAVAQSLYNRGKMPQDAAFNLWYQYNKALLSWHEKFDFDIVNFNLVPEVYQQSVTKALQGLGIAHPAKDFHFFDSSLRHADIDDSQRLPSNVENLYRKLLEISL